MWGGGGSKAKALQAGGGGGGGGLKPRPSKRAVFLKLILLQCCAMEYCQCASKKKKILKIVYLRKRGATWSDTTNAA